MSTRRVGDDLQFDHGAQFVRPKTAGFSEFLEILKDEHSSNQSVMQWEAKAYDSAENTVPFFVGGPAMNKFLSPIAHDLEVEFKIEVQSVNRVPDGWRLSFDQGEDQVFGTVISTVPVVQARRVCAEEAELVDAMANVSMAPCWALMIAFDSALPVGFDTWRHVSETIGWIARDSSKPLRGGSGEGDKECWVVHASPEWSTQHLELEKEQAAKLLEAEFRKALGEVSTGDLPAAIHSVAHRWRYAQTIQALGKPYLANAADDLFIGGDWCLGARVEAAYESGTAIAEAVAVTLS